MERIFNDQNFTSDVKNFKGTVLVDFWAEWCGPCRIQGPIVEQIAHDLADSKEVKIGKLNVDENPVTAQEFSIMSIPTIIIYKDGKVAEQMIGLRQKEAIVAAVKNHMAA